MLRVFNIYLVLAFHVYTGSGQILVLFAGSGTKSCVLRNPNAFQIHIMPYKPIQIIALCVLVPNKSLLCPAAVKPEINHRERTILLLSRLTVKLSARNLEFSFKHRF